MQQFNEIEGVKFTDADMTKYRAIPLRTVAKDSVGPAKMIRALEWMEREIEHA